MSGSGINLKWIKTAKYYSEHPEKMICTLKNGFLSFLCTLIVPVTVLCQNVKFVEENGAITLYAGGSPRFSYQKEIKALNGLHPRANYVHPLYALSGEILTEDFPEDHLHHRGIFWTWHQLYVKDKRIADPWFCEGISWEADSLFMTTNDQSATLEAHVYWITSQSIDQNNQRDTVLREHVKIRYTSPTVNYYELDFEIKLTPLVEELKIGGSEDEKGYGGFSVRLKTPEDLSFYAKAGRVSPQNTPVEAGGWIDVKGPFNPDAEQAAGVIIMARPNELKSFKGWILRKKDSMQNPAFPGREPITLSKDKPLIFKNKVIVYQEALSGEEIEKKYAEFLR